jgi:hypothetical protein
MSVLLVFGGRLASVMTVEEKSVSTVCSFEEGGGSKMGVMGSRVGGNVGGMRSGRSTRERVRVRVVGWVGELLLLFA